MAKEPQPTDIDQKLIAFRRRTAGSSSKKEKSEKMPDKRPADVSPADPSDDFSRRLKISPSKSQSKLFNPDRDPIPTIRRTAEPEAISDGGGSSYAPRSRDNPARHLFDHRKDDPVRFSVLSRPSPAGRPTPTPKSSGGYVSASGTSSYAPSQASTFTLSSTTDGSSASSALFDKNARDQQPTNLINIQLKKIYRDITNLESKIKTEDADESNEDTGRSTLHRKGKHPNPNEEEDAERDKWKKQVADHKHLAELIHNLFEISLAPSVPASLRNIPTKYNMITRLWKFAFFTLLESLRRAAYTLGSRIAREHLQDFLIYAYTFYTGLYEEPILQEFRGGWLEALGDLARFQMVIAAYVTSNAANGVPPQLTAANLTSHTLAPPTSYTRSPSGIGSAYSPPPPSQSLAVGISQEGVADVTSAPKSASQSISPPPAASVGIAAARLLEIEPEKEMWRRIARDWYGISLTDQPGNGKLHHYLGMLCAGGDGMPEVGSGPAVQLRGVYHFVKSMTSLHPFPNARERILSFWAPHLQLHRQRPDASAIELFVLLHGMLFTNIQLDDFHSVLERLMTRLEGPEKEWIEERDWVMMAIVNVASMLEYGRTVGLKEKDRLAEKVRSAGRKMDNNAPEKMDVDNDAGPSPSPSPPHILPPPSQAYRLAVELTFSILSHVMRHPLRRPGPFGRLGVNPYLTVLFTFLSTILKNQPVSVASESAPTSAINSPVGRAVLERGVPWHEISRFLEGIPRGVMASQGFAIRGHSAESRKPSDDGPGWTMLTSGCAPPLPEDWCIRGMEWVGRRVYERGFWKGNDSDKGAEVQFLNEPERGLGEEDGIVEDDDDENTTKKSGGDDALRKRWVRILRGAAGIADIIEGFHWVEGTREWKIEGLLEERVEMWAEEDRIEREAEEARRHRVTRDDDDMDVDDEPYVADEESDPEEDDEEDSDEIKALKARRRYLKSLLATSRSSGMSAPHSQPPHSKSKPRRRPQAGSALPILPGYSVLIIDTNILLSSLALFASLVESNRWTVIVPLPVIMELDGLTSGGGPLGEAAKRAVDYVAEHIKVHGLSLKVQTSRGNYLSGLSFRREDVDFGGAGSGTDERNMDDLILRTALCHGEQWIDRSGLLRPGGGVLNNVMGDPVKVVLLTMDRNLRLKARSRQLPVASERELATILSSTG